MNRWEMRFNLGRDYLGQWIIAGAEAQRLHCKGTDEPMLKRNMNRIDKEERRRPGEE